MVVYDCFVDDGEGDKVQLLNADGCAEDKHLVMAGSQYYFLQAASVKLKFRVFSSITWNTLLI
jgi:hypothetical protein